MIAIEDALRIAIDAHEGQKGFRRQTSYTASTNRWTSRE